MDINEIMACLPHRYPLLLVDRVVSVEKGRSIRALKNVTLNESFFAGHFPGFPVMPGVLIIEALAQTAAILAQVSRDSAPDTKTLIFFAGIDNARFRRQVVPGDQLVLEAEVIRIVRGVGKFHTRALVDGEVAAEGELMAAIRTPAATRVSGAE
ncbi:MAG: 3-hydroxyacyl-ACP dehydratase FabZ [Pseudomonadota bacterium]|nr:3-hydroxyacyl-ACP dehydratase FabZ [Pseudomonadota bacterium]